MQKPCLFFSFAGIYIIKLMKNFEYASFQCFVVKKELLEMKFFNWLKKKLPVIMPAVSFLLWNIGLNFWFPSFLVFAGPMFFLYFFLH